MSIISAFVVLVVFLWDLFKEWLWVMVISFTSLETIWIITPIWISWFFAEFFQEKRGTSFGNAISNGVVPFWVGIDWMRQLTTPLLEGQANFSFLLVGKYLICLLVMAYGLIIIIYGVKGKDFVPFIGRIREVSYVLIVFTPFIYSLIEPTYQYFLGVIIFFPVFYFLIEAIDYYAPEPDIYREDTGRKA